MIYLFIFVASFLLTYLIRTFALKKSLLATVNERSLHTIPTPHGGGIAIALTWFIGLIYLMTVNAVESSLFYALLCGSLLSIVSFVDDVYELSAKLRLFVQAFVTILGLYALGGLERIDFGFWVLENLFLTNGIAFLGIMWAINLYNFLDGIDGYAGSEAIFLALSGWFLVGGEHLLFLSVSVAGFLVWNWNRAKIFMGDVGSTLLGYNIAIFALYDQNHGVSIFVWVILFGLFWFDATLTLLRRYKTKEKLSEAHRKHAYQRAAQSGLRHDQVVWYAMAINSILLGLGYGAICYKEIVLIWLFASLIVLYGCVKIVDQRKKFI